VKKDIASGLLQGESLIEVAGLGRVERYEGQVRGVRMIFNREPRGLRCLSFDIRRKTRRKLELLTDQREPFSQQAIPVEDCPQALAAPASEETDSGSDEEAKRSKHQEERDQMVFCPFWRNTARVDRRRVAAKPDGVTDEIESDCDRNEQDRLQSHDSLPRRFTR
jgi:hypothetical protein